MEEKVAHVVMQYRLEGELVDIIASLKDKQKINSCSGSKTGNLKCGSQSTVNKKFNKKLFRQRIQFSIYPIYVQMAEEGRW